ncbi:Zinc finger protein 91 [Nymphon striatum]|nr:Zinc finger protein 91 [Nymphon striatum]
MQRHFQHKHCNAGRHGCPYCSKSFAWKTHLTDHVKKMHASQSTAKYQCTVCGALFFTEKKMLNHRKIMHPTMMCLCLQGLTQGMGVPVQFVTKLFLSPKACTAIIDISIATWVDTNVQFARKLLHGKLRLDTRSRFACSVCHKTFSLLQNMHRHYQNKHCNMGRHGCSFCSKSFTWKTHLTDHVKKMHASQSSAKFKCSVCGALFFIESKMINHMMTHPRKAHRRKCSCPVCGKMFNLSGSMYNHYRNKHINVARKSCPHCSKTFAWDTGLSKHLKEYHPDLHPQLTSNNFQCQICNRIFVLESSSKHTCTACGKVFSLMSTLSNHFRNKHIDVARKPCPYCSKTFAWDMGLKKHLHAFHSSMLSQLNAYDLQCEICKQQFVFEAKLATHMRKMHPRNRSCRFGQSVDSRDVNAAQTFIKMSLAYVDSSSDEDTFDNYAKAHKRTCPVCGKVFKHAATMSNHRRNKHYDNDRKQCPYCSKTFAWDLNMKTHVKTYHAKEFARTSCKICDTYRRTCPVCGKLFKLVSTMSNHYRNKHVDNERKECPYCSKTFAWDFNMKTHVKTYHAKEFAKTTCTICGRRFVRESELNFHYNKNHPLI